jgi:hypothetical protein
VRPIALADPQTSGHIRHPNGTRRHLDTIPLQRRLRSATRRHLDRASRCASEPASTRRHLDARLHSELTTRLQRS